MLKIPGSPSRQQKFDTKGLNQTLSPQCFAKMTQLLFIEDGLRLCCVRRSSLHIYAYLNASPSWNRETKLPAKVIFIAQTEPG